MESLVIGFLIAHKEYFAGLACGYAIAHIPQAVLFVFKLAMRVPWLRAAVIANPAQAKEIVDTIARELDKDIDAESATPPAPAP